MKIADQYLRFVRWSDEDNHPVGYCPDLFRWGGVCPDADEQETSRELRQPVDHENSEFVAAGEELPPAVNGPTRKPPGFKLHIRLDGRVRERLCSS